MSFFSELSNKHKRELLELVTKIQLTPSAFDELFEELKRTRPDLVAHGAELLRCATEFMCARFDAPLDLALLLDEKIASKLAH